MKIVSAAAIALLVGVASAGPAEAQNPGMAPTETPLQKQYAREKQDRDMIEKDYDKQMQRLKKQSATPTSNDPWATVRPAATTETKKK